MCAWLNITCDPTCNTISRSLPVSNLFSASGWIRSSCGIDIALEAATAAGSVNCAPLCGPTKPASASATAQRQYRATLPRSILVPPINISSSKTRHCRSNLPHPVHDGAHARRPRLPNLQALVPPFICPSSSPAILLNRWIPPAPPGVQRQRPLNDNRVGHDSPLFEECVTATQAQIRKWTTAEFERLVLQSKPRVAVFDCDGTLWSGDSGYGFMEWSIEQGLVSRETSD